MTSGIPNNEHIEPISMAVIVSIALTTGLETDTIVDLLRSGWTYETKLNEPRKWIGPDIRFDNSVFYTKDREQ